MTDLKIAIDSLTRAIATLKADSDNFYATGDYYHGNTLNDARTSLGGELHRLQVTFDYLTKSLAK
jgi:hypothetical protein